MTPSTGSPPPPYRTSPWYDPHEAHQPCQCRRCQRRQPRSPRARLRTALVFLGGVALPGVSLLFNQQIHVIELGTVGVAAILLSMTSVLAHLALSPCRLVGTVRSAMVHHPPTSTWLRALLLAGAVFSCLTWGSLGLLFVPILPLSLVGVVFGIGLCGLCPYGALAIAVVHTVRDYRAVRQRLGRLGSRALLASLFVVPIASTAAVFVSSHLERQRVHAAMTRIDQLPHDSQARLKAIAELSVDSEQLAREFVTCPDTTRRRLIAQVYHRVTDTTLDGAVHELRRRPSRRAWIRPWAIVRGAPLLRLDIGRHLP